MKVTAYYVLLSIVSCIVDAKYVHPHSSLRADEPGKEAASDAKSWPFERAQVVLLDVSTNVQEKLHEYLRPLSGAAVMTTVALQLSPLPSTLEIRRDKSVKRYDGYPYFSVLAGASQWCIYGTFAAWQLRDATFLTMVAANGPGLLMGVFYISSYFQFVPTEDARRAALKRYLQLGGAILCAQVVVCCLFWSSARLLLGLLGSIGSAQIALSPFKTLPEVLSTRSTKSWPLDLCIWNFIQSMATGGFGLANNDAWVWVPNVIGVAAAVVQLTLILAFGGNSSHASNSAAMKSSKAGMP